MRQLGTAVERPGWGSTTTGGLAGADSGAGSARASEAAAPPMTTVSATANSRRTGNRIANHSITNISEQIGAYRDARAAPLRGSTVGVLPAGRVPRSPRRLGDTLSAINNDE